MIGNYYAEITGKLVWLFCLKSSVRLILETDKNEVKLRLIFDSQQIVLACHRHSLKPAVSFDSVKPRIAESLTFYDENHSHHRKCQQFVTFWKQSKGGRPNSRAGGCDPWKQFSSCSSRGITCFISNTGFKPGSCCL